MDVQYLVCPACRTHFEGRGRRLRCPSCGTAYAGPPPAGAPGNPLASLGYVAPSTTTNHSSHRVDGDGWDYFGGAAFSTGGAFLLYIGLASSSAWYFVAGLLVGALGLFTLKVSITGRTSTLGGLVYVIPKVILGSAIEALIVVLTILGLVISAFSCST